MANTQYNPIFKCYTYILQIDLSSKLFLSLFCILCHYMSQDYLHHNPIRISRMGIFFFFYGPCLGQESRNLSSNAFVLDVLSILKLFAFHKLSIGSYLSYD